MNRANSVVHPYNRILFSHEKGNADTCYNMNLEDTMLSDMSQAQKVQYCMFPLTGGS